MLEQTIPCKSNTSTTQTATQHTITKIVSVLYTHIRSHYIKTHDSESRGQEEAGRMRRMSVLFTGSTGVKFVKALNKPP